LKGLFTADSNADVSPMAAATCGVKAVLDHALVPLQGENEKGPASRSGVGEKLLQMMQHVRGELGCMRKAHPIQEAPGIYQAADSL
jgi:hypothetical protein